MATCNPFKVGDKVKVKMHVLRAWPRAFKNYLPVQYAVVTEVEYNCVFTDVEDTPTHFEHFEFYKEEKDMNQQTTPQAQQKTKRVPFNPLLKDAVVFTKLGNHLVKEWYVFSTGVVATLCENFLHTTKHDQGELEMEIPVTTKRIPFNPELKDAKVFYGKIELIEWVRMSSDVVCGVHEQLPPFKSLETALYHPNDLEMEIET